VIRAGVSGSERVTTFRSSVASTSLPAVSTIEQDHPEVVDQTDAVIGPRPELFLDGWASERVPMK